MTSGAQAWGGPSQGPGFPLAPPPRSPAPHLLTSVPKPQARTSRPRSRPPQVPPTPTLLRLGSSAPRLPAAHSAHPRHPAWLITAPPPGPWLPQQPNSRAPTASPAATAGAANWETTGPVPHPVQGPGALGSGPEEAGTSRQVLAPGASHLTERTPENKSGADLHHISRGGLAATEVPKRRTSPTCPGPVAGLGAVGSGREAA